jgi:oligopeptide transport system substrate-binding protein
MSSIARRAGVVALAVTLATGLAACGGGDKEEDGNEAAEGSPTESSSPAATEGGEKSAKGRFSIEISEPQKGLVPGDTNETSGAEVLDALFTGLVDYDVENSEPQMAVAESIESKDNKTWTVRLKSGYTFHNGEKVTAKSFVDAWNYAANKDKGLQNRGFFSRFDGFDDSDNEKLKGLEVKGDREFTIKLTKPFSQLPVVLGYTAFYPLPEEFYDDPEKFNDEPIGNGPFKMNGKWEHNRIIKVDRYDDYNDGKAKSEGIDFKIYANLDTAYNDLRAGNLDIMDALPTSALANAEKELGDRYVNQPSSVLQYLGFPTFNKKYTADFRKAVSMAIDRAAIAKTIFNDTRIPATSYVSPVVDGARKDPCGEFCQYNVDKAKDLLKKSGWEGTLTLAYNADGGHKEWIEAAEKMLEKNLGLQVDPKPYSGFDQMLDELQDKKLDGAFRMGWSFDYPSIENYLAPIFGTDAIESGSNHAGYSNKALDNLIEDGDVAKTAEDGIEKYQDAEDLLFKDMPYLPMFFSNLTGAYSERVKGVKFDAFTRVDKMAVEVSED